MNAILELPEVRARVSRTSVEDYHRQPERNENGKRTELIRGIIVGKIRKSPLHEYLSHWLFHLLLDTVSPTHLVRKEAPLTLCDSEPEPDVSVVIGRRADYRRRHPTTALLAVEVAVSSVELDREKVTLYAEAGVSECWLVLAERRLVEVLRNPIDGAYRDREILTAADTLRSQVFPQVAITLADLFQDL